MKKTLINSSHFAWLITCFLLVLTGCRKNIEDPAHKNSTDDAATKAASNELSARESHGLKDFVQVNLVGDNNDFSPARIDSNLINAWGMAFAPTGPDWISAEVTGKSVIYNTSGNDVRPPVTIPTVAATTGGHPTGVVFNGGTGFKLPNGNPARFIFVGVDGVISGWNGGNAAIRVLERSATSAYTGLAMAGDGMDTFIYAANFRARRIDVFDKNWNQVFDKPFHDFYLPRNYSPFNIQNVGGKLFVTYAKVAANGREDVGPGKGFVNVYRANGNLLKRFATRGELNAPWGVAMAPAGFIDDNDGHGGHGDDGHGGEGHHKGGDAKDGHHGDGDDNDDNDNDNDAVILIGNFGDGRINAYREDGHFIGALRSQNRTIEIDGLWAISFAPATATTIDPKWLFFAAGPGDEAHGLFGYLHK